jgi:predicted Zn-dependent peptidase
MREGYHKEVLKNRIRVLSEKVKGVRSVSLGVWVNVGSVEEEKEIGGVSHFIEHMIFKGTERRGAREIAETIEGIGGELSGFTTKEHTCYYVKVSGEKIDVAVDLLSDIVKNSIFLQDELERERMVILEEIRMYEDTPDELIHDLFISTALAGHRLGEPVIGRAETVKGMRREDILSFYKDHYTPDKTIISVAGNFEQKKVMELVREGFSSCTGKAWSFHSEEIEISPKKCVREKDTEQMHIIVGAKGVSVTDNDRFVLSCLNTVLGGGMSSRLFYQIRERRGLAYSVYSYISFFRDGGLTTVYCGTSPEKYREVISLIIEEFKKMKEGLIDEKELRKAKEHIKGSLALSLENTAHRMMRLAKCESYFNRHFTIEEIIEMVERVTPEDIRELSNRIFLPEYLSCVMIGPVSQKEVSEIELVC